MSALTGMRARIADATLNHTAKFNICQMLIPAVTGVLAGRIEVCRAWYLTVATTRSDGALSALTASGTKLKPRSGTAAVSVGDRLPRTTRLNARSFSASAKVAAAPAVEDATRRIM